MKRLLLPLFFIVLLAVPFAGCASAPGTSAGAGHTLETALAPDLQLPFPTDDLSALVTASQRRFDPVTDLDKPGVLQRFGRPGERLTPDLWIYWRFHGPEAAAENGGHDTLVVVFARGRVSGMKLVQGERLRAYLAGAWPASAGLVQR